MFLRHMDMGYIHSKEIMMTLIYWMCTLLQGVTVAWAQLLARLCLEQKAEQQVRADTVVVMATLGRKILHLPPLTGGPLLQVHVHVHVHVHVQLSRVQIPSEAAQCFFHCLPSDYALPCLAFLCIYIHKI